MWQYNHAGTGANELMHYGKKGMKWGRRTHKSTTSDGGTKKVTEIRIPFSQQTTTKIKNKDGSKSLTKVYASKDQQVTTSRIKNSDKSKEFGSKVETKYGDSETKVTKSRKQIIRGRAAMASSLAIVGILSIAELQMNK